MGGRPHVRNTERQKSPLGGAGRAIQQRQIDTLRGADGGCRVSGQAAGRSAQSSGNHRGQARSLLLSRRRVDGAGLPRFRGIRLRNELCAGHGRSRRGCMRAGASTRADRRAAVEAACGSGHSAHAVHQQDRYTGRQRERHARRLAGVCRLAAGVAPGADHAWRGGGRLCRCGERAGLSLPQGAALGADSDPVRGAGRRAGRAEQAGRGVGGSRRCAARKGAGGRKADHCGNLQRPAQGSRGGSGDRGAARGRGECGWRATPVEGAASRYADGAGNDGAQGDRY